MPYRHVTSIVGKLLFKSNLLPFQVTYTGKSNLLQLGYNYKLLVLH